MKDNFTKNTNLVKDAQKPLTDFRNVALEINEDPRSNQKMIAYQLSATGVSRITKSFG